MATLPLDPMVDPMVIAIGANGDGVLHWRHYVHQNWSQWIPIGTIFCCQWRQWREPQYVMTLLPDPVWSGPVQYEIPDPVGS